MLLKDPSNMALNTLRDGVCTISLCNLVQCLIIFIIKNISSQYLIKPYSFSVFYKIFVPVKKLFFHFFKVPYISKACSMVSTEPFLLQDEQPQLRLFSEENSDNFCGSLVNLLPHLSCAEEPRVGCSTPAVVSWKQNHLPRPVGHTASVLWSNLRTKHQIFMKKIPMRVRKDSFQFRRA